MLAVPIEDALCGLLVVLCSWLKSNRLLNPLFYPNACVGEVHQLNWFEFGSLVEFTFFFRSRRGPVRFALLMSRSLLGSVQRSFCYEAW